MHDVLEGPEGKEEIALERLAATDCHIIHNKRSILQSRSTHRDGIGQLCVDLEKLRLFMELVLPDVQFLLYHHACDLMRLVAIGIHPSLSSILR